MAKKKSKAMPFIIGAVIVGGVLLIPVIINKLRPGGTVPGYAPNDYQPMGNGNGAYYGPSASSTPGYAHLNLPADYGR